MTAHHGTGKCAANSRAPDEPIFSPDDAVRIMAGALGREMRAQRFTNEQLARLTRIKERRIEALRSYTEDSRIYLEEVLALATVLGDRFVSGLLAEVNMYAAEYRGASPEAIASEAITLLQKLTGAPA